MLARAVKTSSVSRVLHLTSRSLSRFPKRWLSSADPIFQIAASNLRFGASATMEVGQDLAHHFRCHRVVVFTDPVVRKLACFQVLLESLERNSREYVIFDDVRTEPNDKSFARAIQFLSKEQYDGVVAMGGGSVLDTAKAANLYACHPADFYDFVNAPRGKGLPVPDDVKPLIAIPTTAGTGSETTGVAIFDDSDTKSKTGIASRHLKPSLGIVDSNNTVDQPVAVATYSGLDVLCHAVESYTALPSRKRSPRPNSPLHRPAYQGSNPVADVWSLYAVSSVAENLPRAVADTSDADARSNMLLASSAAGMGFGNAGVHLAHGMSYPISSQVRDYSCTGYRDVQHAMIPHGLSVIVNAPAVFTYTGLADPERHATCARILQKSRLGEVSPVHPRERTDAGAWLADEIRELCCTLNVKLGLKQFGYTEADIPSLVEGTIQQHRVTKISPREVNRSALEQLFLAAMNDA